MSVLSDEQKKAIKRIVHDVPNIDLLFPEWARRKNPLVARELGEYWRVFIPEIRPILIWVGIYSIITLATVFFPILYMFIIVPVLISGAVFPFILYQYMLTLLAILQDTSLSIAREYENNTIDLIRVTPYTSREIILSKISAGLWRRVDTLSFITLYTAVLGLPIVAMVYVNAYSPEAYPFLSQIMTIIAVIGHLLRVPLEMLMVSSVGVLMGVTARKRQNAVSASIILIIFYFVMVNMLRFIEVGWLARLLLDVVVPSILPIIITGVCIEVAVKKLEQL